MSDRAQSALAGAAAEDGLACRVEEAGLVGMVTLRGTFSDKAFRNAAAAAAGVAFPETRRISGSAKGGLAWMSPDELLLFCEHGKAGEVAAQVDAALDGAHHLAAVVSDARAVFRLTGDAAREVLAKGAPVDLSRGAFGPGDFRRTRLGQVAVAFGQVGEGPDVFELVCFRSVAGFVFDWLRTAASAGSMPGFLR